KADSVEMQAWLRVWTSWQPDVLIDNHTTDGHDHQYVLFYAATDAADVAEPIRNWVRARLYPNVLPQMASDGHLVLPYSFPQDGDPAKGIQVIPPMGPRLSTGYAAACNRVGILVETHALLPYGPRVQATYDFLRYVLRAVGEHAGELRTAVQAADEQCARVRGGECGGEMPLVFARAEGPRPITFHGVVQAIRQSEISGGQVIDYTKEPLDITTELYDQFKISAAVDPPRAYLVPPQWTDVIRRLELHGIQLRRLTVRTVIEVESYRFEDVKLRNSSYEGRQPAEYKLVPLRETRAYPAGSVLVRLDQPRAKLAVHMLEPAADDSCAAWGCFNAIFEQKEYAEAYVLEPLARQMLADEPGLREEFETRLKSDAEFAKSPQERLRFFYQRSEYRDRLRNVYPVGRLTDAAALEQLPVR
ncbi:MAG: peptidase M14, partial [Planctomycetota bacterium]